ncbi:transcriptional regulator PerR [Alkaliphilus hydrothermalis]|uniref:Fur family peroxide stress response transcriptional regulator n=1 Tax=Alkaliphilus hydrothermalis TaxID=1482730 RepID=A0ABS2NNH4_9FIRM|nr:Fur family transcriptional regulator [Alkaliphilus hydrothermalis]MBM7614406.1 Fur family peroxide stress response transcriptional regulator [Alkaliphilus hydrothermalis]
METLVKVLKEGSCKITPQRIAVYNALKDNLNHPNAEAIYNQLAPTYPTISLATVYKSLDLFAELGLIQIINIGENSFRYDCKPTSHPHVICTKCHKVEDLEGDFFSGLSSIVEEKKNYQIQRQQLSFFGICPECSNSNN